MVELRLQVPDEHVGAVYRFVGELLAPEEPAPEPPPPAGPWSKPLAAEAIEHVVADAEHELLRRLAEARGQRVPLSELAAGLGLPGVPDVAQDFAGLSAWCSAEAGRPPVPVHQEGEDTDGWYWMPIEAADRFLAAFADQDAAG